MAVNRERNRTEQQQQQRLSIASVSPRLRLPKRALTAKAYRGEPAGYPDTTGCSPKKAWRKCESSWRCGIGECVKHEY